MLLIMGEAAILRQMPKKGQAAAYNSGKTWQKMTDTENCFP